MTEELKGNVYYLGESLTGENITKLETEMNLDDVYIIASCSHDEIQKILAKEVLRLHGRPFVEPEQPEPRYA